MKKIIFLMVVLFVFVGVVFAGSTMDSEIIVGQGQSINQDFSSGDSHYYGTPEMLQLNLSNGTINSSPQVFPNHGSYIWCPKFTTRLKFDYIKAMANKSKDITRERRFDPKVRFLNEPEYIEFICPENIPTPNMHIDLSDVYEIGHAQNNTAEPVLPIGLICDNIVAAVEAQNAHVVMIEVFPKNVTNTNQGGETVGIGFGMPFGGDLHRLGVGSTGYSRGSGYGQGMVETADRVILTSYNKMPPIIRNFERWTGSSDNISRTGGEKEKVKKAKVKEKTTIIPKYEIAPLPKISFNTGSSEIKDTLDPEPDDPTFIQADNQFKKVDEWTEYCYKELNENPSSIELLWLIGVTDYRWIDPKNSKRGNLNLGMNRSENLHKMVAAGLEARGVPMELIKKRIIFASIGKEHPLSQNLSNNRTVVLVKGEIRSKL